MPPATQPVPKMRHAEHDVNQTVWNDLRPPKCRDVRLSVHPQGPPFRSQPAQSRVRSDYLDVNLGQPDRKRDVHLEFGSAQLPALQRRELHLKKPVLAHKHDVVVGLRVKLGRRVDGLDGVPTRMEPSTDPPSASHRAGETHDHTNSHLYESMHNGIPWTLSGSSNFLSDINTCSHNAKRRRTTLPTLETPASP